MFHRAYGGTVSIETTDTYHANATQPEKNAENATETRSQRNTETIDLAAADDRCESRSRVPLSLSLSCVRRGKTRLAKGSAARVSLSLSLSLSLPLSLQTPYAISDPRLVCVCLDCD